LLPRVITVAQNEFLESLSSAENYELPENHFTVNSKAIVRSKPGDMRNEVSHTCINTNKEVRVSVCLGTTP
jgi:hypothetical protein